MSFKYLAAMVLGLLASVLAAGCNPKTNGVVVQPDELILTPKDAVSIYQLAGRLRMHVAHSTPIFATLTNGQVSVMVFADPGGQVLVNGKPVGPRGGIVSVADTLFVPLGIIEPVRAAASAAKPAPVVVAPAAPVRPPLPMASLICLDPGHGGRDPGAPGRSGAAEKHVNLTIALLTADILRSRGVRVILTRTDDSFVELNDRPAIASRERADLLVSIHADASSNPSADGFTAYVSRSASGRSVSAAQAILYHMAASGSSNRGMRRADYRVLVRSACPAVLVELGYLSNQYEAMRLAEPAYQGQLAQAIADGVIEFLR
jgi:N-acetylmuramoyl-L-alanine amidase